MAWGPGGMREALSAFQKPLNSKPSKCTRCKLRSQDQKSRGLEMMKTWQINKEKEMNRCARGEKRNTLFRREHQTVLRKASQKARGFIEAHSLLKSRPGTFRQIQENLQAGYGKKSV